MELAPVHSASLAASAACVSSPTQNCATLECDALADTSFARPPVLAADSATVHGELRVCEATLIATNHPFVRCENLPRQANYIDSTHQVDNFSTNYCDAKRLAINCAIAKCNADCCNAFVATSNTWSALEFAIDSADFGDPKAAHTRLPVA
jgi:hypothetical protein